MLINSLGRELPEKSGIMWSGLIPAHTAPPAKEGTVITRRTAGHRIPGSTKLLGSLKRKLSPHPD